MRIAVILRNLSLLTALGVPCMLSAQFQAPTEEELKMTTDPKAPGAAAVYLNYDESRDDLHYSYTVYTRIKVLQEKGKELATVQIPYYHGEYTVANIQGRTIHSDGKIVPLSGKPSDLLIQKEGEVNLGRKVFTLPSAEVGSILEYRYMLIADDYQVSAPYWEIQKPYFVHQSHYYFTPFSGFIKNGLAEGYEGLLDSRGIAHDHLVWLAHLPSGAQLKQDAHGRFSIDLTDIPAMPEEAWMPPIQSILYRVVFSYAESPDLQNYWLMETKLWSKNVDHFAEASKPIHEAVNGLIAAGDSDLDKARKLYAAVQALDNTDFSRKKGKAELKQLKLKTTKRAEDTWAQKSGSRDDIALLYLAMLRAAGLTAYAARVVDRQTGIFDSTYLSFDQLDDDIVILATGGQEILLDPGEKLCPFQTLSWRHSGASGARQSPNGHDAITTPFPGFKANTLVRIGDVTVDARGSATGSFRFVMTGQEALRWRQEALKSDLDEVKKEFDRDDLAPVIPEGLEAHIDHFVGLDNPETNLVAVVNAAGVLGAATSKRLILPGFFFESRGHQPFIEQENRLQPVDMHFGEVVTDQVAYHIADSLVVEGSPQDAKTSWPENAVLISKTVVAPGAVTVGRTFGRFFTVIQPKDYQDLRGFYQKVAAADQQQLVLTISPAAKGN